MDKSGGAVGRGWAQRAHCIYVVDKCDVVVLQELEWPKPAIQERAPGALVYAKGSGGVPSPT